MDQGAILILIAAAMMAQKSPPACRTVAGQKPPQLVDIKSDDLSTLSTTDEEMLGRLAAFMRRHNCRVVVQGFVGPAGKENEDLARANRVKDFLTKDLAEPQRVRFNQVEVQAKGAPPVTKRVSQKTPSRTVKGSSPPRKLTPLSGFARVVP